MNTPVTPIQLPRKNSNSPFSGMRAGHVGVWTSDYEALMNWYTEKLDFQLLVNHTAGTYYPGFPDGEQVLLITGPNNTEVLSRLRLGGQ